MFFLCMCIMCVCVDVCVMCVCVYVCVMFEYFSCITFIYIALTLGLHLFRERR